MAMRAVVSPRLTASRDDSVAYRAASAPKTHAVATLAASPRARSPVRVGQRSRGSRVASRAKDAATASARVPATLPVTATAATSAVFTRPTLLRSARTVRRPHLPKIARHNAGSNPIINLRCQLKPPFCLRRVKGQHEHARKALKLLSIGRVADHVKSLRAVEERDALGVVGRLLSTIPTTTTSLDYS